jgi:hypothetical protein
MTDTEDRGIDQQYAGITIGEAKVNGAQALATTAHHAHLGQTVRQYVENAFGSQVAATVAAITGQVTQPRDRRPGLAPRAAVLERQVTLKCSPCDRFQRVAIPFNVALEVTGCAHS